MTVRSRLVLALFAALPGPAWTEEEVGFETIECQIVSIEAGEAKAREAQLGYGAAEGIVEGTRGEVFSSGNRGCEWIGHADIVAVEEHSARARVTFFGEDRGQAGDVVQILARVPRKKDRSILWTLAKQGIVFTELDRQKKLFTYAGLYRAETAETLAAVLEAAAEDMRSAAEHTKELPPLAAGRYKGKRCFDVMANATPEDVLAFLDFVASFPGKYIGHEWRISETFAVWTINDTPEGGLQFLPRFPAAQSPVERAALLKALPPELEGRIQPDEMVSAWRARADELAEMGRTEEALFIADLAVEAGRVLGLARGLPHSLFQRASVLSEAGRHAESRQAYVDAAAAFRALTDLDADDRRSAAFCMNNAAAQANTLGLYAEAFEGFRAALPLFEEARVTRAEIGRIHRSMGDTLRDMGRYDEAIREYEEAAAVFTELGEHGRLQEALLRIAKVFGKLGESAKAAETYERVLAELRRVKDRAGEAKALRELAEYHRGLGELRQALAACDRAEAVWRDLGDDAELSATLSSLGRLRADLGDPSEAEKAHGEALALRRARRDRAGEAESLNELGALRVSKGEFRRGLETYEEARALCAADGDAVGERAVLDRMVDLLWERSEFEEALMLQDRLVALWRESGAQADLAYAVLNRGALEGNLRDFARADRDVEEALAIFRAIRQREGEAAALEVAGNQRAMAWDYEAARRLTSDALAIFREVGNKSREAGAARRLGQHWGAEYRFAEAKEWYDRALAIFRHEDLNAPAEIARTHLAYASALSLEGDFEGALALRREALGIAEKCGDRLVAFQALQAIGETLLDVGRRTEAREALERAGKLADEAESGWLRANLWWSLAMLHKALGEPGKSLEFNDRALAIWRKLRNRWGEAAILHNRAQAYLAQGDAERALVDLEEGFPVAQGTHDQQLLAGYLSTRAEACVQKGDLAAAIAHLEAGLVQSRAIRHKPFVRGGLVELARARRKLAAKEGGQGGLDAAAKELDEALRLAREMKSPLLEGSTLAEMGALALVRGDAARARDLLLEARTLVEPTGARHVLAEALLDLSRAEEALGDLGKAVETRRAAVAVTQEIRAAVGGGAAAEAKFLRSKIEVYESMASLLGLLIRAEEDPARRRRLMDEALEFVSRARFEVLPKDVAGTGSAEIDRLLEEIRKAERELARLEEERRKALEAGNHAQAERIATDIARKEEELGELYLRRKGKDPDMDARLKFDPRAIDLSGAPADARLLLYFPGRTSLQIWVFSKDGFLVWREYPISRDDLYGLVDRHAGLMGEMIGQLKRRAPMGSGFGPEAEASAKNPPWYRENARALRELLQDLFRHLIAPVAAELEGSDLLLILPYGRLNYLPFEALLDAQGRFLGAQKRLVYFANDQNMATTLARLEEPRERVEDLWVGYADPCGKLVDALEEAAEIEKLFPAHEVHTRKSGTATEAQLERTPEGCTILHFATHGYLDRTGGGAGEPPEPFLELAKGGGTAEDDGRLKAGEVWPRLKRKVPCLRAKRLRLVVLSACDTARAQDDPQAEVLGLPDVFVAVGAPAVLASLWSVYSWTTTDLMVEFYGHVARGEDLASALREARRALLAKKDGLYAHPFYWAPFLLFGDWR